MKNRLALFDSKSYDEQSFRQVNEKYGFELTFFEPRLSKETAILAKGFEAICLFVHDTVDAQLVDTLCHFGVRLLALRSNGYNHIDLKATKDKLKVVRVPKYTPYAVAEFTVGLMLSLNRKIHLSYWRTRTNNFSLVGLQGFDMHGKTVGIIGSGLIGSIVARLLHAFGMNVLIYDQRVNQDLVKEIKCTYTDLETLFKESHIITLHCPLTPETHHLINASNLAKMRPEALIVNTSRGGLIHTNDLIQGLKTKQIGGAALDVYEEEERFFFEDLSHSFIDDDALARLMTFPNVLVSAHQAFFTQEALEEIAETTLMNVIEFNEKRPLKNEVTYSPSS
jgi:D-lactate dehydrogenase